MIGSEAPDVVYLLAALHVIGLLSAWMVRVSEGSSRQIPCQCLFLAWLCLAGTVAMVCAGLGPGYWLASGTSVSLMVVCATCEFRKPAQPELL